MAEETSNIETFPGAADATAGLGTTRQLPNNLPAEQNLLGALLLDNDVMEKIDDGFVPIISTILFTDGSLRP